MRSQHQDQQLQQEQHAKPGKLKNESASFSFRVRLLKVTIGKLEQVFCWVEYRPSSCEGDYGYTQAETKGNTLHPGGYRPSSCEDDYGYTRAAYRPSSCEVVQLHPGGKEKICYTQVAILHRAGLNARAQYTRYCNQLYGFL